MGKSFATGAYYMQRIKIRNLSTKIMPKVRAISRCISSIVHMCNDRPSTQLLAARNG
jgi:hypothetical protein